MSANMTSEPTVQIGVPSVLGNSAPLDCAESESWEGKLPVTLIKPESKWSVFDLWELWRYRELLFFLTWRDIKVRYKQSVLGVAWALLQPLATMLVFSLFFGKIGKLPSGELPYPIFVLAGLLPWFFLSNAVNSAGQSIVGNQNLITKVYFPRLLIPMGAVSAGLVDFAISFGLLALMMTFYGVGLGVQAMLVLPLIGLIVSAAFGLGVLLSALTVTYRDFRYIVPFAVQLWMFSTPAIYMQGSDSFGPVLQALLPLNPAYGLILAFRSAVLGGPCDIYALVVSCFVSLTLLLAGCWYFRRVEKNFADVI